jgi:hypothetical protein
VVRGPILVVIDADLRSRRLADQSADRQVDGPDQHPLRENTSRVTRAAFDKIKEGESRWTCTT